MFISLKSRARHPFPNNETAPFSETIERMQISHFGLRHSSSAASPVLAQRDPCTEFHEIHADEIELQ